MLEQLKFKSCCPIPFSWIPFCLLLSGIDSLQCHKNYLQQQWLLWHTPHLLSPPILHTMWSLKGTFCCPIAPYPPSSHRRNLITGCGFLCSGARVPVVPSIVLSKVRFCFVAPLLVAHSCWCYKGNEQWQQSPHGGLCYLLCFLPDVGTRPVQTLWEQPLVWDLNQDLASCLSSEHVSSLDLLLYCVRGLTEAQPLPL